MNSNGIGLAGIGVQHMWELIIFVAFVVWIDRMIDGSKGHEQP